MLYKVNEKERLHLVTLQFAQKIDGSNGIILFFIFSYISLSSGALEPIYVLYDMVLHDVMRSF